MEVIKYVFSHALQAFPGVYFTQGTRKANT